MNYHDTVREMVMTFAQSADKDNKDLAEIVEALGRGLAAVIGSLQSKRDVNIALETAFIAIRNTAMAAHSISAAIDRATPEVRTMTAEEFLRDEFKPEKQNG